MKRAPLGLFFLIALGACSTQSQGGTPGGPPITSPSGSGSKITHVVIIVQENRSVDNLFHGLRGADTANYGYNSLGKKITLEPVSLTAHYDISHQHDAFTTEYANGQLDGFNLVETSCAKRAHCPPPAERAYAYVPQSEVAPYFSMAEQYAFADHMFQTNQGPSFPAHQ
jgi:phospholipase C